MSRSGALRAVDAPPLSGESAELGATIASFLDVLRRSSRVLVTAHRAPDGDAVASTLACCLLARALGVEAVPFNVDQVPESLRFLPGADTFRSNVDASEAFDGVVVVDCTGRHRVGEGFPERLWRLPILAVDHHRTWDPGFATVTVRDEEAASCTEVLYRIVSAAGVPLTPELATCLFAGLHTDTGSFRYGCTVARTMELARNLLQTGISTWDIASELYENQSEARVRLLGRVLDTLRRSPCGRVAVLMVTRSARTEVGASGGDADGFVNMARSIRGVELAVQLTEVEPSTWQASIRSTGRIDASRFAEGFGGGGHRNAAGCTLQGTLDDCVAILFAAVDSKPTEGNA